MAASPGIDILIVGAGPTGLVAAIEAARHGLSVRVIDKKPRRATTSKALVVHARTLEVFETVGVVASILRTGARFSALNVISRPDGSSRSLARFVAVSAARASSWCVRTAS